MEDYYNLSASAMTVLLLSAIFFIAALAAPALAETYIYKDADGVYRTGTRPDEEAMPPSTDGGAGNEMGRRVEELYTELMEMGGEIPPSLFEYYKAEYTAIIDVLNESPPPDGVAQEYRSKLDDCGFKLKDAQFDHAVEISSQKQEEAMDEMVEVQNKFMSDVLTAVVRESLNNTRLKGGTRVPTERLELMLNPLEYRMTGDEVRALWGSPMRVYKKFRGDSFDLWQYPMKIGLGFTDGELTQWGPWGKIYY